MTMISFDDLFGFGSETKALRSMYPQRARRRTAPLRRR